MFHKSQVKQQLEAASQLQAQTQEYAKMLDMVEANIVEAQLEIDQLGMSAAKMDRSLTKVVDYARETKEEQESVETLFQNIKEQTSKQQEQIKDLEEFCQAKISFLARQEQQLVDLQEQSKRYTGLSKTISELNSQGQNQLQGLEDQAKGMQQFSSSISVLALQSAIDAGRMGDEGKSYIKTAEEIRSLSNDFATQAGQMQETFAEMQRSFNEMQTQIHSFISLLKDNTVSLSKIAGETATENQKAMADMSLAKAVGQVTELLDEGRDKALSAKQKQECIMSEMENIGSSYMEQQESTDKIEGNMSDMKRVLTNRDKA